MDTFKGTYSKSLARVARAAMNDVVALKKDDRVLIIAIPDREITQMSEAFFDAALEKKAPPTLLLQRTKGQCDFAEEEVAPPQSVHSDPRLNLKIFI